MWFQARSGVGARERHHRPVPEVDPVAAPPDPAQRRDGQREADAARGMHDRGDQDRGGDGDGEDAAAVDERVVVLPRDHGQQHGARPPRAAPSSTRRALGRGSAAAAPSGQANASSAPTSSPEACVSVPKYTRDGSWPGVKSSAMASAEATAGREREQHRAARARAAQHEPEGERPEQVELLLDRERPQVLQQRRALRRPRSRTRSREQLVPVVDVGERGERVGARARGVGGQEERRHDEADADHQERGRQQAARAPRPRSGAGRSARCRAARPAAAT